MLFKYPSTLNHGSSQMTRKGLDHYWEIDNKFGVGVSTAREKLNMWNWQKPVLQTSAWVLPLKLPVVPMPRHSAQICACAPAKDYVQTGVWHGQILWTGPNNSFFCICMKYYDMYLKNIYPLNPKSDQHQISPHNINTYSQEKRLCMWINTAITKKKLLWSFNKLYGD